MNSHIYKNELNDDSQRFHLLQSEKPSLNMNTSPIRRVNIISGPQSAFARLFPDKYRQQEELMRRQRSKSSDNQRYQHVERIRTEHTISDDDDDDSEGIRKSRRVRFHTNEDDNRTKSEPFLDQMDLSESHCPVNYDPNPELIYRDNPDDLFYTQKVGVRYLRPPTPPPHGAIVIREVQPAPPEELPPYVVSATP
jgi:hypothetical protein